MRIFDFFQSCAGCSTSWRVRDSYCPNCWTELERNFQDLQWQNGRLFNSYSLLIWLDTNDHMMRPMIYSMKGEGNPKLFSRLVTGLSMKLISQREQLSRYRMVIPPTSRGANHAYRWAQTLNERLGWEKDIICLKRRSEGQSQKQAVSQFGRKRLKFEKKSGLGPSILFIDDVLTTGSTAQAAFEALGNPCDFKVLTLLSRAKLAELHRF